MDSRDILSKLGGAETIREANKEGCVKRRKRVQIVPPEKYVSLQDWLEWLSKGDSLLTQKLKAMGLPPEGECCLTTTPGRCYGPAYNNFTVNSVAELLGNVGEINSESVGGLAYLSGPESGWRVWRIWLMDIACNGMDSHIRYMWNQTTCGAIVTIEGINQDLYLSHQSKENGSATARVVTQLRSLLPGLKIIELVESQIGRPRGTGWFKSVKDFRTALKEVLATQTSRPPQLHTLKLLDDHRLCHLKPAKPRDQSHTKALRDWLHRAKLKDYDDALRQYWQPSKKRK